MCPLSVYLTSSPRPLSLSIGIPELINRLGEEIAELINRPGEEIAELINRLGEDIPQITEG